MLVNLLTEGLVFIAVNECGSAKLRMQYTFYAFYVTFTQYCNHICLQNLEAQYMYMYVMVWNRQSRHQI